MNNFVLLAVDDKPDNLFVLEQVLAEYCKECKLHTADTAEKGLEIADKTHIDVAIIDLQMPGMDGIEMCRRLKARRETKFISVILLTAHKATTALKVKGLEAGADEFITKPIDGVELATRIKVILRTKEVEDTLRKERDSLEATVRERTKLLIKSNRALKLLSETNHAVVYTKDENELLETVCKIIVESGDYKMAWIGFAQQDENKTVLPGAQAGVEDGYLKNITVTWSNTETGQGPAGSAIRLGKPFVARDILSDLNFEPWREAAMKRGYTSCISLPLHDEDGVFGALTIYSADTDAFQIEEVCLLEDLAKNFSYGIQAHRKDAQQRTLQFQLQQAQKMEAIGTLAGGIAHDFNNILFPISGFAEMAMADSPENSTIHRYIGEILIGAQRATDLVQQILSFSRQSEQQYKPLKVQLIIKETIKFLRSSLPTTIKIDQDIDKSCNVVLGDPTQIHQIVMNLCTNAYHAMQESGGKLTVALKNITIELDDSTDQLHYEPGPYVHLSISDNGHGMNKATMDRIFEPYFTTKEKGKGTGLGLSVVHGIVKGHGGDITVDSEPGKGTIFNIYLPSIETGLDESVSLSHEPLPMGDENILFVDDEEQIFRLMPKMLKSIGYNVTAFTRAREAVQTFQMNPKKFDLVITDQTMPFMTGLQLANLLIGIRPDIPIILCTGFSETVSEAKAKASGIREFVMKPIIKRNLAITIRKVLDEGDS